LKNTKSKGGARRTVPLQQLRLTLGEVYEITWEDACGRSGWKKPFDSGVLVRSVGYLVHRDKRGLCLASGLDPDDEEVVLSPGWVPAGMVKKVRKLR
jgi:hypothetical protein